MTTPDTSIANLQLRHCAAHRIALVCLGNSLRADDAIASALLSGLHPSLKAAACILDAGSYTADIPKFLHDHQIGIVIDACASQNAYEPDEPIIIELHPDNGAPSVYLNSVHGFSWYDELVLSRHLVHLPPQMVFFGIPVRDTSWRQGLSTTMQNRLPHLLSRLTDYLERQVDLCTKQQ